MTKLNFTEAIDQIIERDSRYPREAYLFVREALDHTQKQIGRENKQQIRHVSGRELLEGIREYGLEQYGPMTLGLLQEWGIRCCEDFGEIVFNMVEHGLLSKTDEDTRQDFQGGYDFHEAFRQPFLPKHPHLRASPASQSEHSSPHSQT